MVKINHNFELRISHFEFIRKKEPFNELATLGDAEKFPAWIFKIAF